MKKGLLATLGVCVLMTSCVSSKKYAELESQQKETQDLLNSATVKLNDCLDEAANAKAQMTALMEQNAFLKKQSEGFQTTIDGFTQLSSKGAENLEKTLESLSEANVKINNLRDAVNRRDSVNLALVQSLKGVLGNMNDEDIQINVEKGVVFVSISDKLLFRSGSYKVSNAAKEVLGKVAKVVNNQPDFEFMVEGHTDNVPYRKEPLMDNWDLSVKRATSVVRILEDDFGVSPSRMTAAGRSSYVPLESNTTAENRAKNRRTRIVVLPKLDQFYSMLEEGMNDSAIN
tara:strand:- start:1292 stop:2152 length:861 start_codon:yes stop_codon:yes gene_type:complete